MLELKPTQTEDFGQKINQIAQNVGCKVRIFF